MNRKSYIESLGQMLSGMERAGAALCRMETGRGSRRASREPRERHPILILSLLPFFLYIFIHSLWKKAVRPDGLFPFPLLL